MDWTIANREWLFSGVGVFVFGLLITWFVKVLRRRSSTQPTSQQTQNVGHGSEGLQAGRDVNITRELRRDTSRQVDSRVHRAFYKRSSEPRYFIKVANTSPESDIEISHVHYKGSREVPLIDANNPFPRTLSPGRSHEWDIPAARIPNDVDVYSSFHVHLSTGEVFRSQENTTVPGEGFVARGDNTSVTGTSSDTSEQERNRATETDGETPT